MSKQHRTKLIKQLEEQMVATTDPQLKLDLAKQITKLMPRPRQRKAKAQEVAPSRNGTSPIVAKWADRLAHVEPETKRILHTVICEADERRRKSGCAEVGSMIKEVMGELSAEERAVLNSGSAEVA